MKTAVLPVFAILFVCAGFVVKSSTDTPAKRNTPLVFASHSIHSENPTARNADILSRPQIPVLCYHQIRDWKPTDSKRSKDYIVPVSVFKQQMKMLADSGYHTITPDQLFDYLTKGSPLPKKPVMLTYDDTDLGQFTVAFPEMEKYNFKGVYFIMTVSLNRPNYMTKEEVRQLSDAGNIIGSHTWDHHNVKLYKGNDWKVQIDKPTQELETITGKPIRYFAYPFGLWNEQAIPELKKRDFKAAFQLITHRDDQEPLYTIRRIIVPGYWSLGTLHNAMLKDF
ncbi:MAG TPA: polysaccharide deacetylase family protein [Puia sp.]|nr:polysaccharide deacetylase family protein [Puia sp.]